MLFNFDRKEKKYLLCILLLSLVFNLSYINWGLPSLWHADESKIVEKSVRLVRDRSLNPYFFAYPSLQIYLILFLVTIPLLLIKGVFNVFHGNHFLANIKPGFYSHCRTEIFLYSRILTAIMGTLTIFIVYLIAKKMFGKKVAIVSAFFLSITAGFINLSHFATVDIPSCFWMTLSLLFCCLLLEKETPYMYFLCGMTVGFAFSTKYTGILMFVPLIATFIINTRKGFSGYLLGYLLNKNLLIIILAVFAGFVIGTPYSLITPSVFIREFIELNFYANTYGGIQPLGFIPHLYNLLNIYGAFLFTVSLLGFIYILYLVLRYRNNYSLLLVTTISIIYLKMGSMRYYPCRYMIIMVPFLTICAGKLCHDLMSATNQLKKPIKNTLIILFLLGSTYTLCYSISGILEIKNDDRNLALEWVLKNIPNTAKIEMSPGRGINIPRNYENFKIMPSYHRRDAFERMLSNPTYKKIKQALNWRGHKDYYKMGKEPENVSLSFLLRRKPDYLILAREGYGHFLNDNRKKYFPLQNNLYSSILNNKTPYKMVVDFRKKYNWLTPRFEFVNAGITIFKYTPQKAVE